MSEKFKHLSKRKIRQFYEKLSGSIIPKPELEFSSAFELLIAVLLSAQCTDKSVNKVTSILWQTIHGPQDFIDMGQAKLEQAIHSIGFYSVKAKHILELSKMLIEKHEGQVPSSFEELTALPGVGTKTANVVLNLWFGMPTIPVDTHIFRVSKRCGLCNEKTSELTEKVLEKITPQEFMHDAHHLLLLLGRYTCKARTPDCANCIVSELCPKNISQQ